MFLNVSTTDLPELTYFYDNQQVNVSDKLSLTISVRIISSYEKAH